MTKTPFPYLSLVQSQILLRLAVSLFPVAHGVARIYLGTVGGFGEFLNSKGFIIGGLLAGSISIFEIVGGMGSDTWREYSTSLIICLPVVASHHKK